ncbi:MAG: DUF234 domain-containing protein [Methanospirillum sp.]
MLPFVYARIGTWWYQGDEIDTVCLRDDERTVLFYEVTWQDAVDAVAALELLEEMAPRTAPALSPEAWREFPGSSRPSSVRSKW